MEEKPDHDGISTLRYEDVTERQVISVIIDDFRDRIVNSGDLDIKAISEKLKLPAPQLNERELALLLSTKDPEIIDLLYNIASSKRESLFDRNVFIRAVIEISNYCRRDCKFCGNAASDKKLPRYRANPHDVIEQAERAKGAGIDLIHLASGEDNGMRKEVLVEMIRCINQEMGCTVELAIGDRPIDEYAEFYDAGARRAILKFETTNPHLFAEMKPRESLEKRLMLLLRLRKIGFQIGSGNIIGLPGQEFTDVAHDLFSMINLQTDMASTSVFVPNQESALKEHPGGDQQMGLNYIALLRILSGDRRISIPTNSTLGETGKHKALEIGALELSLNMTPTANQKRYSLYGGKDRFRAGIEEIEREVQTYGYKVKPFSQMQL